MKRLLAAALLCVFLCGCGVSEAPAYTRPSYHWQTEAPTEMDMAAVMGTVDFTVSYDGGLEYAVLTCTASDGSLRWQVRTQGYEVAQVCRVSDVGQHLDRYYFVDDGDLVALRMSDGSELWRNTEFGGSPAEGCAVIGEDGTVYLAGYFGPELFIVHPNGVTSLCFYQLNPDYYWPCRLELVEDGIHVYMEGGAGADVGASVPLFVELP